MKRVLKYIVFIIIYFIIVVTCIEFGNLYLIKEGEYHNINNFSNKTLDKYDKSFCKNLKYYMDSDNMSDAEIKLNIILDQYVKNKLPLEKRKYYRSVYYTLYSKYEYIKEDIPNSFKDLFWDFEYKVISDAINRNKLENLDKLEYEIFNEFTKKNLKENEKEIIYKALEYSLKKIKENDKDCRITPLKNVMEGFQNLKDYKDSKKYYDEINFALKFQGEWKSVGTRDPHKISISYFGNKAYQDYIFNSAYRYKGVYKFEKIDDKTLKLKSIEGDTTVTNATIKLENNKIIFTEHFSFWNDETTYVK